MGAEAELLAQAVVSTFVGADGLAKGNIELGSRYRAAITRSGAWRHAKLQPLWFRSRSAAYAFAGCFD